MNRAFLAAALASAGFISVAAVQPLLAQQAADAPEMTRADALAHADARFDQMDTNKDGKLSPDEMVAMRGPGRRGPAAADGAASPPPPPAGAARAGGQPGSRMFARLDANGDGVIDREEYRALAAKRFDRMDANKDGKIDAEERDAARDSGMNRKGKRGQRGAAAGADMPAPTPSAPNSNAGQ